MPKAPDSITPTDTTAPISPAESTPGSRPPLVIEVDDLVKRYAGFTAVNGISFDVKKGEIVGFLGPNGAGKSTTMRILSSYLSATSGKVEICGHDVFKNSLEARRRIGYMPENVPLYTDMRVDEYLRYRGALKSVRGKRLRERLSEVKELCNLTDVGHKMIGTLSKGYRQRVGLADAMIHEPDLLILDEPTIGLDPNQIRQVRDLIRNLGKHHTILLSTHILPEVEMTCSRVLIINHGRIEASDSPENLLKTLRAAGGIIIEAQPPYSSEKAKELLEAIPQVRAVDVSPLDTWIKFSLRTEAGSDVREEVFQLAKRENWILRELSGTRATLEDVFIEITQN